MSTDLEAQIAEVLATHIAEAHYYIDGGGEGHMECRGCDGKWASFHGFYEHQAAMLAPLIREAQAKVLTEFADAHRMPEPLFMDDGRAVTVGDLLREKAAQLRSNDE